MNIELILSISGVLIAIAGIVYTLTVDKRVKQQEEEINNNVIAESKQANFVSGVESYQKMSPNGKVNTIYELVIENTGKQPAKNFSMETSNGGDYLRLPEKMFPINLFQPGQKLSFQLLIYSGIPDLLDLKFKWDDDFKKGREMDYTVKTT